MSRQSQPMDAKRRIVLLMLSLGAGLALFACGNDDGSGSIPDATSVASVPAGAPLIDQDNLTFIPNKVTVKLGSGLYLKNSEDPVHTVTIDRKNVSGTMKKNDIMVWFAPAAGTYKVTCDFHPLMLATITVE